jgi:hypothetical protein
MIYCVMKLEYQMHSVSQSACEDTQKFEFEIA